MAASIGVRGRAVDWADTAVAVLLAAMAQYEIWAHPLVDDGIPGPRVVNSALFMLIAAPLLWRRRAPLAVLGLVIGAAAVQAIFFDDSPQPSLELFVAVLIVLYSVGANSDRRRALIGAALAAPAILAVDLPHLLAGDTSLGSATSGWFVFAVVWSFGRYLGRRRLEADSLRERAARLEIEREEKARLAVIEERARIARELHDVVAHSVSVIVVQARGGRRVLALDPEEARQAFDAIESTGRHALAEMRRLLGLLRRSDDELALAPQPSVSRLAELVEQLRAAGLPVDVSIEGEAVELPPGVDLSAYRIVQEALTNTLKHADGAKAQVVVRYRGADLELEICDDGAGVVTADGDGGQGLIGMRERVAVYGGEFESGYRQGGGYGVRVRLPLHSDDS
jgi:signal transduction histidine kinase